MFGRNAFVDEEKQVVWKINKFSKYPVNSWKWLGMVTDVRHEALTKYTIGEGDVEEIESEENAHWSS